MRKRDQSKSPYRGEAGALVDRVVSLLPLPLALALLLLAAAGLAFSLLASPIFYGNSVCAELFSNFSSVWKLRNNDPVTKVLRREGRGGSLIFDDEGG